MFFLQSKVNTIIIVHKHQPVHSIKTTILPGAPNHFVLTYLKMISKNNHTGFMMNHPPTNKRPTWFSIFYVPYQRKVLNTKSKQLFSKMGQQKLQSEMIFKQVPSIPLDRHPTSPCQNNFDFSHYNGVGQKVIWPVGWQIFTKTMWCFG